MVVLLRLTCYATVQMPDLVELLSQTLPIAEAMGEYHALIEDKGLKAVASCCKELRELRVFPSGADVDETDVSSDRTWSGLSVSEGCPNIEYVLYFLCPVYKRSFGYHRKNPSKSQMRWSYFAPGYIQNTAAT